MPRGRSGSMATGRGFTYDFGFAIARSDLRQLGVFTGQMLSLTTAVYGLAKVTEEWVNTVKKGQLFFGGQLRTIKTMQWAQEQLLKGATEFSTSDIMQGMQQLQSVGVDAAKNFKFMSDAANASGQSFTQFAGAVSQAISGNMGGLVQMGLLTQRATRQFDKYYANTVVREQAIMNFIKSNKALHLAISENFNTISGQWRRIIESAKMFGQTIMGNPHDPNSFYGRIVSTLRSIGDWMYRHRDAIRKAGAAIGMTLGWITRQVGHVIQWLGRQFGIVLNYFDKHTKNFKERMYSFVLTLELWKVHIVSFLKAHGDALKALAAIYLAGRFGGRILGFWGGLGRLMKPVLGMMEGEGLLAAAARIGGIGAAVLILAKNWEPVLSIVTSVSKVIGGILDSIFSIIRNMPLLNRLFGAESNKPGQKGGAFMRWVSKNMNEIAEDLAFETAGPGDYKIGDAAEANRQKFFNTRMMPTHEYVNRGGRMYKIPGYDSAKDLAESAGQRRYAWEYLGSQLARGAYKQTSESGFQKYISSQLSDAASGEGSFANIKPEIKSDYVNWLKSIGKGGLAAYQDMYEKASGGAPDTGYYGGIDQFAGGSMGNMSGLTGGEGYTVNMQPGAVTIIVNKGDSIDEDTLARKIPKVLNDFIKKQAVRSGNK